MNNKHEGLRTERDWYVRKGKEVWMSGTQTREKGIQDKTGNPATDCRNTVELERPDVRLLHLGDRGLD